MEILGIPVEEELKENPDDCYDDYKVKESDIQNLVNDREEFLRLKAALKAKGAITNEMCRQRLHVYVRKNRDRLNNSSHSHQREKDASENLMALMGGRRRYSEE